MTPLTDDQLRNLMEFTTAVNTRALHNALKSPYATLAEAAEQVRRDWLLAGKAVPL